MSGERLTCVWEAAYAADTAKAQEIKFEQLEQVTEKVLKKLRIKRKKWKTKFDDKFQNKEISFEEYKAFLVSCIQHKKTKADCYLDSVETTCWSLCADVYKSDSVRESDMKSFWVVFNHLAHPNTYPPTVSQTCVEQLLNLMAEYLGKTWKQTEEIPANGMSFDKLLHLSTSSLLQDVSQNSIKDCINSLYDAIVKEILKAGWLYLPAKTLFSRTARKYFVLTPQKLLLYETDQIIKPTPGKEISFTSNSKIESLDPESTWCCSQLHGFVIQADSDEKVELCSKTASDKREWIKEIRACIKAVESQETPLALATKRAYHMTSLPILHPHRNHVIPSKDENDNNEVTEIDETGGVEADKVKTIFYKVDRNGNGRIDKEEFKVFVDEMGLNLDQKESDDIFESIDISKNGTVELDEFQKFFTKLLLMDNSDSSTSNTLLLAFLNADRDGSGKVNFREFSEYALSQNQKIAQAELMQIFDQLDGSGDGEVDMKEFKSFLKFGEIKAPKETVAEDGIQHQLKSLYDDTDSQELGQFLSKRWKKFADFKRYDDDGNLVMTGSKNMVADFVPGEYSLLELSCFNDLPPITPKYTKVKATWNKSGIAGQSGECIFPADFDGVLPIEISTNEYLAFYQCSLAGNPQLKVSLMYRHGVQDFTYGSDYLQGYVSDKGAGIEIHNFHHMDCPLEDDCGYMVIGKMEGDELYLTAFKVPARHTLYVPAGVIHSNDYMTGTWRTMLSDEAPIEHVRLVRPTSQDGQEEKEHLTFTFS